MTIVQFKFDKEKDLYNIWQTCNTDSTYGDDFKKQIPNWILKICKGKNFNQCKNKLLKNMEGMYKYPLIKAKIKNLNETWGVIEKEYFKKLKKLTGKQFPFKKINVYITTISRCPYWPHGKTPYLLLAFSSNIQESLQIIGHELMHIHFHNTYWNWIEKEIGKKKTGDLKEALTELLNEEFRDLWIVNDRGYPNHIKLRKYISKQWNKEKDFDKLTDNCIKWIKRNGIK